jgi:hypothetical protein
MAPILSSQSDWTNKTADLNSLFIVGNLKANRTCWPMCIAFCKLHGRENEPLPTFHTKEPMLHVFVSEHRRIVMASSTRMFLGTTFALLAVGFGGGLMLAKSTVGFFGN